MTAMTSGTERVEWFGDTFEAMTQNIERAVLGKRNVIRLTLACLVSEGHLLIEDFPGTGKTMLAGHSPQRWRGRTRGSSSRPTCCRAT